MNLKYIISLYEKILKEIRIRLNKKLCINKSERYWRVILGPWLIYYLMVNFDRWETISKSCKNDDEFTVVEFKNAKDSLHCFNTLEFIQKSQQSDFFNHALFLRILKFQFNKKIEILNVDNKNLDFKDLYFEKSFEDLQNNDKEGVIFKLISHFALRFNKIIFDGFNYPKKNFINLNIKLFSIPIKTGKYFSNYNFKNINKDFDRDKIFENIVDENNPFEKYINEFLGIDIPQSLFEAIPIIKKKIKNFVKKRLILSMYSFMHCDFFKIWLAESIDKGSRLIISEHGGGLDSLLDFDRKHYTDIADRFVKFSGTYFSKKDIQMSPIMSVLNEKFNNKKGEHCTLIDLDTAKYTLKIINNAYPGEKQKILQDQIIFTENLKKDIFKKIKYRIVGNHMGFAEVLKNKFGPSTLTLNKVLDKDTSSASILKKLNNNIFKDFRNSKIIVCAYPQTPFFEAMISGIPTILFCRYKYWEMKKESKEMFDLLKESKIAFEDPILASSHINEYWENTDKWWLNKKTVNTRKFYLENFYKIKKDWDKDWFNFVSQEYEQVFPKLV